MPLLLPHLASLLVQLNHSNQSSRRLLDVLETILCCNNCCLLVTILIICRCLLCIELNDILGVALEYFKYAASFALLNDVPE